MFTIPNINIGRSNKSYTHDMSFDNNTTFDFGSVQPLMCQYMLPQSEIKVNYRQLVRLAPLVVPSFARLHLQTEVSYVPVSDVCPYYECLVSKKPFNSGSRTYIPTQVPYTNNVTLVWYLLFLGCKYTVLVKTVNNLQPVSYHYPNFAPSDFQTVYSKLVKSVFGNDASNLFVDLSIDNLVQRDQAKDLITVDSADYVIEDTGGNLWLFRLSPAAKRLRKVLIGCGYSLNITDSQPVSILPLLGFCKVYNDLYAVNRSRMWTDTSCFGLIKFIEHDYYVDFTNRGLLGTTQSYLFLETLSSLSQCWYTYKDDYVSVHRPTPQLVDSSFNIIDGSGGNTNLSNPVGLGKVDLGLKLPNTNAVLYNTALKALSRLSKYVNKDSVIAQRISTWIRAHYGADVSNSMFEDSNHISSTRLDLEINDVMSTSDTATADGGSMLGELAGKGLGFDKSGFSFNSPSFGFLYVLSAIVPTCGYFQGNASHLYALDFDTIPNPDFDCLGYELTPKGMICGDNNILFTTSEKLSEKTFGFVPRYSMFKVNKNIVNGDMSRRGVNADMSPYYLDRVLVSNLLTFKSFVGDNLVLNKEVKPLPCASEEWRYCCKHPFLGDPYRIFQFDIGHQSSGASILYDDRDNNIDDHFICQTIFDVKYKCFLKPLSDSFDTFDDTDTNTMPVNAE